MHAASAAPERLMLFGAGSSLIVDYEESCAAAGARILGIVRNIPGPCHALNQTLAVALDDAPEALLAAPALIPLFTPQARRFALGVLRERLGGREPEGAVLVDPWARVPPSTSIGAGSYVNAGAVLGAAIEVGRWCVLNRACSIGHHSRLGDLVSIGPGAVCAGWVRLGEGAMIGAGATICPEVTVGPWAKVGAGAVVRHDVPAGATVVGNPARILEPRPEERPEDRLGTGTAG